MLSSLHSREGTRMYAKLLNRWESSHSLTDEEKQENIRLSCQIKAKKDLDGNCLQIVELRRRLSRIDRGCVAVALRC